MPNEHGYPTNNERAAWAQTALSAFVNEVGTNDDVATDVSDLIGDLMHLADAEGFDIEEAVRMARANYYAEIDERAYPEGGPKADCHYAE